MLSGAPTEKAHVAGLNGFATELGKVAPFVPPTNHSLGLDELKDTLPFKSEASQNHPTKPNTAQKLKNPEVPMAPTVPAKLDKTKTHKNDGKLMLSLKGIVIEYWRIVCDH